MPACAFPLRPAAGLVVVSAVINFATWSWLGQPIIVPGSPLDAALKVDCISYTPFQANDDPFEGLAPIPAALIAADVARLTPLTKCLRTYSASTHGIEEVAAAAERRGLTVLQGAWISRDAIANERELAAAAQIAKAHPGTVTAIVAGNEVLLRQEQTPEALIKLIGEAKALSGLPVTYADVWEFWLKNPQVASAVDFITIHILPYWEDEPVASSQAAAHVAEIYDRIAAAFPGKRIIIGEVGWPSAGRMRAGARASRADQVQALHGVLVMTRARGIFTNVIEAFDQPWKRRLEGTTGGNWGLYDASRRLPKFSWSSPVSNFPNWESEGIFAFALSALVIALAGLFASKRQSKTQLQLTPKEWIKIGFVAIACSFLAGLSVEILSAGAFGLAGISRSLSLGSIALASPFVAVALAGGAKLPNFTQTIGPTPIRSRCPISWLTGIFGIIVFLAAISVALTLVFDPRYWEFSYAPLSAAALALVALRWPLQPSFRGKTTLNPENLGALVLTASAIFIALNEGLRNWQALWLAAALLILAAALWTVPGAPPAGQTPEE